MLDLILAIAHHLLMFALLAVLVMVILGVIAIFLVTA